MKEPGIRLDFDASDPPGMVGFHTPYVFRFPDGTLRMYYDTYGASPREMRSAVSVDGLTWLKEPGSRLSAIDVGTDSFGHAHIVSLGDGRYRMYFETQSDVESALSTDGLVWQIERGVRVSDARDPVVVELPGAGLRMYFRYAGTSLALGSAVSTNGLGWQVEPGVRVSDAREFAVVQMADGSVRIFYAKGTPGFTSIDSARSFDGINFIREPGARLLPGGHPDSDLDSGRILSTSILAFPDGTVRMYYQGSPSENINDPARVFSAVATFRAETVLLD